MKTFRVATGVAALLISCAAISLAAPKTQNNSPAARARVGLEQMNSLFASMVNTADELALEAPATKKTNVERLGLDELKDQVNRVNLDLRILHAQAEILPGWQNRVIEDIAPLMKAIIENTQQEIDTFNSNPDCVWATAFPQDTATVYQDAVRAQRILSSYLKSADSRTQEESLETVSAPATR